MNVQHQFEMTARHSNIDAIRHNTRHSWDHQPQGLSLTHPFIHSLWIFIYHSFIMNIHTSLWIFMYQLLIMNIHIMPLFWLLLESAKDQIRLNSRNHRSYTAFNYLNWGLCSSMCAYDATCWRVTQLTFNPFIAIVILTEQKDLAMRFTPPMNIHACVTDTWHHLLKIKGNVA